MLLFTLPIQKQFHTKGIINTLCQVFIFTILLMIYFTILSNLLKELQNLLSEIKDLFSITDQKQLKFLQEANSKYRIRFLINENIIIANPTDKPKLPEEPQSISEYNLTILITLFKQFISIVKWISFL